MWTILLVEDEAYVRRSLRKNSSWNESGFEVIGEASNGCSALEFMREHQPDLVICDIVMPIMNGIELLQKTKEAGLSCLFVMLTCMNEFEYARSALQNGAFNYMLKLSMDATVLRDTLSKVDEELQRRAKQTSLRLFFEYQPLYKEMWGRLTDLNLNQSAEPFYKQAVQTGQMLPHLLVCSVLNGNAPFAVDDFMKLDVTVLDKHAVIHLFPDLGQTTVFYWSRKEIKLNPLQGRETPYPVVVCTPVPGVQSFEAWRCTLRRLDEAWYSGQKRIHLFDIGERIEGIVPWMSWKIERKLIQYFEQAQVNECDALLQEIWSRMEQGVCPMHVVKHTANQFDNLLHRIANYSAVESDDLSDCTHHQELLTALLARLKIAMGNDKRIQESFTDHNEINKVLDYVHEHYDKPITLKTMARYVALEEHYLSSLFKKKTGSNFIDYVHGVRIEKAKHFLDRSGMSVQEVGRRVGFVNDNYFIKIFKRIMNMTPSMYRGSKEHERT